MSGGIATEGFRMEKNYEEIAKRLYPNMKEMESGMSFGSDYSPLLYHFGIPIIRIDDDDYQGNTWLLWHNGYILEEKFSYLMFGWGSCSGCDALLGCRSYREVGDLIEELEAAIKFFPSTEEALEFFNTHDWQGDFSRGWETKTFVALCKVYLTAVQGRGG